MKLKIDLTREKAIDMLLNNNLELNLNVNLNKEDNLEDIFSDLECQFDQFKSEIEEALTNRVKESKELAKLMTHELYELGEEKGYWHLKEKQRRLI